MEKFLKGGSKDRPYFIVSFRRCQGLTRLAVVAKAA
jgi:hypothetical protein